MFLNEDALVHYMPRIIQLPKFIAQEFERLNPERQAMLRAGISDVCEGRTFQEQSIPLEQLGMVIRSPRFTRGIQALDEEGKPVYGGKHDKLEGVYCNPEPAFCRAVEGLLNQEILHDHFLAFRDGKEVQVWGKNGCTYKTMEGRKPFFGGAFDEVYCMDFFVPDVGVQFYQAGEVSYSPRAGHKEPQRFILGRLDDTWVLRNIRGDTAASGTREALEKIVACTVINSQLTLFSL